MSSRTGRRASVPSGSVLPRSSRKAASRCASVAATSRARRVNSSKLAGVGSGFPWLSADPAPARVCASSFARKSVSSASSLATCDDRSSIAVCFADCCAGSRVEAAGVSSFDPSSLRSNSVFCFSRAATRAVNGARSTSTGAALATPECPLPIPLIHMTASAIATAATATTIFMRTVSTAARAGSSPSPADGQRCVNYSRRRNDSNYRTGRVRAFQAARSI